VNGLGAAFRKHIDQWRAQDPDGFDEWLGQIPVEALIHGGETPVLRVDCESEVLWGLLPPKRPETRRALNRRIAERLRAAYRLRCGDVTEQLRAKAYLDGEKSATASAPNAHRCACCGAMIGPADAQCDYCGVQVARTDQGCSSRVTLDALCPLFLDGNTFNPPSCAATTSNLKTLVLDGSFEDGLDLLTSLRTWHKGTRSRFESPTSELADMFTASESAVSRGIQSLARSARGDSDRQRRLVAFAVGWRRDVLKESLDLGIGGWFAGKDKKDAAWEKKVRDELGL
jgi:hypothetical protein